jgi:hypothetical protein
MGDTSTAAAAAQARVHEQLGGPGRLRLALELSQVARELALAGLRHRHPDWSSERLHRELLRLALLPGHLPPPLR